MTFLQIKAEAKWKGWEGVAEREFLLPHVTTRTFLVAQSVKNLPAVQETQI